VLAIEDARAYPTCITGSDLVGVSGRETKRAPALAEAAMSQSPNRILNSLPQNVFAALEPQLRSVDLKFGQVIAETDELVSNVYFPHSGIISLVVEMLVGDMIETAMVGRDGVANATSALDGKIALHKGLVQVDGVASVINPDALRKFADEFTPFRSILIRHEQVLLAQAQQSAGCNASHTVEAHSGS
jgi:hypothetical protein